MEFKTKINSKAMTKLCFLKSLLNIVLKPKLQLQFDSVHLLKTKPPDYNKCTKKWEKCR